MYDAFVFSFQIPALPSLPFASSFTIQVKVVSQEIQNNAQHTKCILKVMYVSINYMEVFPCSSEVKH